MVMQIKKQIKNILKSFSSASLLFLLVMPASTTYQLKDYGFGSGGAGNVSSGNYSLNAIAGEISGGRLNNSNLYGIGSGLAFTNQANVPAVPTFTNPSNYYNKLHLVINDGDMGSNVLSEKRGIKSVFVTNQFRPKLWRSHFFFYPSLMYISKQIAKATKIVVADSAPPNTICEYNLNFPDKIKQKVVYAGHFADIVIRNHNPKTDLEKLLENADFGYWMQTGNKATKEFTGIKYEEAFHSEGMQNKKRLVSHAQSSSSLDRVKGKDGKTYSFSDALEHNIDWIQIDVGFLSEQEKDTTLDLCKYAVINGSHTAMGEIIGIKAKPIIGIPVYDEHTNQIKWAEERKFGILANNTKEVVRAVYSIQDNYNKYEERLEEFSRNFDKNGAQNAAQLIADMLES